MKYINMIYNGVLGDIYDKVNNYFACYKNTPSVYLGVWQKKELTKEIDSYNLANDLGKIDVSRITVLGCKVIYIDDEDCLEVK